MAFQQDAFQNDAFQVISEGEPPPLVSSGLGGTLEMELNGRGNGWTEVLDWLVNPGVRWNRGMSDTRITSVLAAPGTLYFTLDNSSLYGLAYRWSPDHTNKIAGFQLGIRVRYRIEQTIRFTGTLEAIDPIPGKHGPRVVNCEVVDWMDTALRTQLAELPVMVDATGDEVFEALLDSVPSSSQPSYREVDLSPDTFPYALDKTRDEATRLSDELYRLSISGLSRIWVDGDDTLVYEARNRRALVRASSDTFTDAMSFQATRERGQLVNKVRSTIHPRVEGLADVVLYELKQPTLVVPGSPIQILGPWTDPENPDVRVGAATLVPPAMTTDFRAWSQIDETGVELTSYLTVTVGISGNASLFTISTSSTIGAYLTELRQRGRPIYSYGPSTMLWEDTASVSQHGPRSEQVDLEYQADPVFALEVAQYLVHTKSQPYTDVRGYARFVSIHNTAERDRSILRRISDRISITEETTGISRAFFIEGIEEAEVETTLRTTWLLSPADATQYWLLEVVGLSELDLTTRLGFGLILGHVDSEHGDAHFDVAHVDVAHSDVTHLDGHGDITSAPHGDAAHDDTHNDSAHQDVAHADVKIQNSHGDIAHNDTAHEDAHYDNHFDYQNGGHEDSYTDVHYDAHGDIVHSDAHQDVPHQDVAHSDAHGDAHTDVVHNDVEHVDGTHVDYVHGDVSHADTVHSDVTHQDSHADSEHGDVG